MRARALALAALLAAAPAAADGGTAIERARVQFRVGAKAYASGRYDVAIEAFEEAYAIAAKPAIVFSLAQAERKHYFATKDARYLRRAAEHFRKYLADDGAGARRADATDALSEIEPMVARLAPDAASSPAEVAPRKTKITVYSDVDGAQVVLDGAARGEIPFVAEVPAGRHRVRVSAPGYFDEERDVIAEEGANSPVDLPMRERPGRVVVAAANACEVYLDGRLAGECGRAFEAASGRHLLSLVANGKRLVTREVELARGQEMRVAVALDATTQRTASWVMLGGGAAAAVGTFFFTLTALGAQAEARALDRDRAAGVLDPGGLDERNSAVEARDTLRTAAFVSGGVTLALVGAGLWAYSFDRPSVAPGGVAPSREREERRSRPRDVDLALLPWWTATSGGVAVGGRF